MKMNSDINSQAHLFKYIAHLARISIAMTFVLAMDTALAQTTEASKKIKESKSSPVAVTYPHAKETIGTVRQIYDGVLSPEMAVNTFRNIDRLFPSNVVSKSAKPYPLLVDANPLSNFVFNDRGQQTNLQQYLDKNRVAGILVLKDNKIKLEQYRYGNTAQTRWMSMSVAKSITSTLVGAALAQGKITSLDDPVSKYAPELKGSGYQEASVRNVLMMASGVRWSEAYTDPSSDRRRLLEAQIAQTKGGAMAVMKSLPRVKPAGSTFNYNTGETQVVAEVLRNAVSKPLATYLSEQIWSRFGMEADAYWWLDSANGTEIGGSGFSATLRDYGRFGLFMLNGGMIGKTSILPFNWAIEATTPKQLVGGRWIPYGYLWWPLATAEGLRDKAYTGIGIHGQFLYINPATHVVIVVWGAQSQPTGAGIVDDRAFFSAVSAALSK